MILPFEKDEWESWREQPITRWLLDKFLAAEAEAVKQQFIEYAWGRAGNDPVMHSSLFERARVLKELIALNYDDIEAYYNSPK